MLHQELGVPVVFSIQEGDKQQNGKCWGGILLPPLWQHLHFELQLEVHLGSKGGGSKWRPAQPTKEKWLKENFSPRHLQFVKSFVQLHWNLAKNSREIDSTKNTSMETSLKPYTPKRLFISCWRTRFLDWGMFSGSKSLWLHTLVPKKKKRRLPQSLPNISSSWHLDHPMDVPGAHSSGYHIAPHHQ